MRTLKYIMPVAAVLSLLASCYKDESTHADKVIPDIIVTGLDSVMNVIYGQDIELTAHVAMEGRSSGDFSYLWEIDFTPGSGKNRLELSETQALDYKVSNTPSDKPYILSLKVTDRITGLMAVKSSRVYVGTSLGEGLLVAYTRDGGATSEFDIVADPVITYGYEGNTRYTRELYALSNGGNPLSGRVLSLSELKCSNGAALNESRIIAGTDSHIYYIDPLTFENKASDAALFNGAKESSFRTTALFNYGGYTSCAVVNGTLYGMLGIIDNVYSKVAYSKTPSDVFTADNFGYYALDQGCMVMFNANDSKFYYIYGWGMMNSSLAELPAAFSADFTGARAVGGGCLKGKLPALLMRGKDGTYRICTVDPTTNDMDTYVYTVDGENMDNIVSVAFCDNADLMYYATSDKIYSVLITGGKTSVSALSWKPDSPDERITAIRQYTQGWYGTGQYDLNSYMFQLPYNRLQLLITTYNEKTGEGKIYMRPFNVSTGRFTFKSNGSLSGFGEITAITPTFK